MNDNHEFNPHLNITQLERPISKRLIQTPIVLTQNSGSHLAGEKKWQNKCGQQKLHE